MFYLHLNIPAGVGNKLPPDINGSRGCNNITLDMLQESQRDLEEIRHSGLEVYYQTAMSLPLYFGRVCAFCCLKTIGRDHLS